MSIVTKETSAMDAGSDHTHDDVPEHQDAALFGDHPAADPSKLVDRTPDWFKTSKTGVWWVVGLGLAFALLSYQDLYHSDLWGHIVYGKTIWETGSVPATEPLMRLSEGMRYLDTAWGSKLLLFGIDHAFGIPGLQLTYALPITLMLVIFAITMFRYSRSHIVAAVGVTLFALIELTPLSIVRPQNFGLLCFLPIFLSCTTSRVSKAAWFVVPITMLIWANLHGSFPVGLVFLGAVWVGRTFDLAIAAGSLKNALCSWSSWQWFVLMELAAAVVLVNPQGFDIYPVTMLISSNPNLSALVEWEPLTLSMKQGKLFAAMVILLVVLYRNSPRRIRASEWLLVVGFGLWSAHTSRMLVWWGPIAAWTAVVHLRAIYKQRIAMAVVAREEDVSGRTGLWTVASAGLAWIFFAYTPFGIQMIHGAPKDEAIAIKSTRSALSDQTPFDLTRYLNDHPPTGLVFNTYEWGDYLQYAGPDGLQVFVNSHAHMVPREVWQDYLSIAQAVTGWDDKLDRYGINTVIIDHAFRRGLINRLKENKDWRLMYEDRVGAVFRRKKPIIDPMNPDAVFEPIPGVDDAKPAADAH
ncbi:hypothetical protein [Lacunimicrobium album]